MSYYNHHKLPDYRNHPHQLKHILTHLRPLHHWMLQQSALVSHPGTHVVVGLLRAAQYLSGWSVVSVPVQGV